MLLLLLAGAICNAHLTALISCFSLHARRTGGWQLKVGRGEGPASRLTRRYR